MKLLELELAGSLFEYAVLLGVSLYTGKLPTSLMPPVQEPTARD